MPEQIRTIDLFCGCGGLACGFDLHRGEVTFETVLGMDIDPAALRVFNRNFNDSDRSVPTGRQCDLSWFSHRSEVLLYYLVHYSMWCPDLALQQDLKVLKLDQFLAGLRYLDNQFSQQSTKVADSEEYKEAWTRVDDGGTNLALFRSAIDKLGLRSLKTTALSESSLPWSQEYALFNTSAKHWQLASHEALVASATTLWDDQVARFKDSAVRKGRGQHQPVGKRMGTVARFLETAPGLALREMWIHWRAQRDTLRASFCLQTEARLEQMYADGREVQLVLGGPPCKGWSRIGRAVVESLRDQGVHAWASDQYGDERNALLHKYVLVLDALRPRAFLFENVAHFQSALRTPSGDVHAATVLEEAIESLTSQRTRFHVESRIVRAFRHGIPQDRERFILVGARSEEHPTPWLSKFFQELPLYDQDVPLRIALQGLEVPGVFDPSDRTSCGTDHTVKAYTLLDPEMPESIKHYIKWSRQPSPGTRRAPSLVDGHIVRKARSDDADLFRYLAPGTRWMDYKFPESPTVLDLRRMLSQLKDFQLKKESHALPSIEELDGALGKLDGSLMLRLLLEALDPPTLLTEGHHLLQEGYLAKGMDRHGDWLERLSPDRPCKTIVAHIGKDTYGYIHPWEPRALTPREAARVQTFPDFFSLGSVGVVDVYSMIGNAVPPLLASHFASGFERLHSEYQIFSNSSVSGILAEKGFDRLPLLSAAV